MDITLKFFNSIINLLMPKRCPFCTNVIEEDQLCCNDCLKALPTHGIMHGVAGGYKCSSVNLYKGKLKCGVLRFKFKRKTQYSKQLAYFLHKSIEHNYPDMVFDYITYVPMHEKSEHKRGFNQCELLAKDLSELLKIPYCATLTKIKETTPQHKLSCRKRRTNLRGAFKVIDKKMVLGKSILIIDDIVTTGSTLGECAKTLQRCKPNHICCATVLTRSRLY